MAPFTFRGLQTSLEGVPQTQTFLTGKNLPGPSKKPSEQPKAAEEQAAEEERPLPPSSEE